MAVRSNFSPKALRESKANDKRAQYSSDIDKYGGSINWSSLSDPVYSKEVTGPRGNKYIVVRQTGTGATPIGHHRRGSGEIVETFPTIGVQRYFYVHPDGRIEPDPERMPEVIRFKGEKAAPDSYEKTSFDTHFIPKKGELTKDGKQKYISVKSWNKKDLLRDWANMIKDKDVIPDIDSMPLFERNQVSRILDDDPDNPYINPDAEADLSNYHTDAGGFLTRENYADEKFKRDMAKANDIDSDINDNDEPDMFEEPQKVVGHVAKRLLSDDIDAIQKSRVADQINKFEDRDAGKIVVHKKAKPVDDARAEKLKQLAELEKQLAALRADIEVSDVDMKELESPMYKQSCDHVCGLYKNKPIVQNIISAVNRRF